MDTSSLNLFSVMKQKLRYMGERQKVLSQNIANANTPGYKIKDVKMDFDKLLARESSSIGVKTTHPNHIGPRRSASSAGFKVVEVQSSEVTPTGNNVVIEDELMKMQRNSLDYRMTTELYRKMTGLIKTALGEK